MIGRRSAIAVLLVSALILVPLSRAAEIKVIASNAVKEAFIHLAPAFERASGHHVTSVWGGTVDITRRIAGGEVFDLVIIPASGIDDLIEQGRLRSGSRTDFVRSAIGVAIAPSVATPDISSGSALRQTLLNARSIVLSSGPSSNYLIKLFKQMGISDAIKPKIRRLAPGLSVGEVLAKGEGDLGFTQVSELLSVKDIVYVGPLSQDVQHVTVFAIGLHTDAPAPQAARSLIEFLTSPAAAPAIEHSGMEPG